IYRSEARRILKTLKAIDAQLLHVYFGHIGVHLLPLLEICALPVVVSFHGADAQVDLEKPQHLMRTRRMIELATLLLVRSESLAERLVAIGCPREKIRLHRTGIPLDKIPFQQRTAPEDGQWKCVQACRLIEKKGLITSLRAFALFVKTHPHATFTIAGEGPQKAALLELAEKLGIANRVFFPGFLSQELLGTLFSSAHLFLHPSELGPGGDQEGVPNSMLEAMAAGLPVVASTHGGIAEAVEHGVSGLLVAEGDHAALAGEMLSLTANSSRYRAMSGAAAKRVATAFDLSTQAHALGKIYFEAVEIERRKSRAP
ncbi:MAG: glycosyltransferase, partial [Verrucomicrobiota bacterium]